MPFRFTKMHGCGNDFIVVDNRVPQREEWPVDFVAHICAAHTGIGADGLLLVEDSQRAGFRMRFFNSDGREAEMCVNGSRCICYFAHLSGIVDTEFTFEAMDGVHHAWVTGPEMIRVEVHLHPMPEKRSLPPNFRFVQPVEFAGFLNTGVPHLVLTGTEIAGMDIETTGSSLRFHQYYAPQGTNVNFVQKVSENSIFVRTFERGVDAETLACGSGVTACVLALRNELNNTVDVQTRGGKLRVMLPENNNGPIYLEGPVRTVYHGTYVEE
jgi:diaminopimelate epimerase